MATTNSSQLYHYHCYIYNHGNGLAPNPNPNPTPTLRFKQSAAINGMSLSSAEPSFLSLSVSGEIMPNKHSSSSRMYRFVVKATETDSSSQQQEDADTDEDIYEVEIEQPYGLKFAKGRDGATYIDGIAPGLSADQTGKFTVGDKVISTSAVFGTEIWPAAEYGRTMYTIRQRIGPLYMKMQKRYGNLDYAYAGEMSEKEIIRAERNAGFISDRVREIQVLLPSLANYCFLYLNLSLCLCVSNVRLYQMQNYQRKMEQQENRERDLREGLQLYK